MTTIDTMRLTPMMAQWVDCKKQCQDGLLFFRLGDFYEAFDNDAEIISRELSLTLTERQGIAMCGVPWHTSEGYIEKLVEKGYRVAIAEQIEDPSAGKGLMQRKIARFVTPGIQIGSQLLDEKSHNFFACLCLEKERYGLALVDITTASFYVYECISKRDLVNELARYRPKELLISKKLHENEKALLHELQLIFNYRIQTEEDFCFQKLSAETMLTRQFGVKTLDGFGLKEMHPAIIAGGVLLQHVKESLLLQVNHLTTLMPLCATSHMALDRASLTNLEIVESNRSGKSNTLFDLLDETNTPMGARKLKEWLYLPLASVSAIKSRQEAVCELKLLLVEQSKTTEELTTALRHVRDLERLIIRIQTGYGGPRDLAALGRSLLELPIIHRSLAVVKTPKLCELLANIGDFQELAKKLTSALIENPPLRISDGGLFREGYHAELDKLLLFKHNSQAWLTAYQQKLRDELGIKTLKIGFTRMFGYYIEVGRQYAEKMPAQFARRQTLANGERYISTELKEYEEKILSVDAEIAKLEALLFAELLQIITPYQSSILQAASAIGEIDVFYSFAHTAHKRRYCCPEINDTTALEIVDGRHPVIEALTHTSQFVPNSTRIDGKSKSLMLITGPNMAGKSTYIRQIALIVIMAQIGSFVPATKATIGVVDKLFSRIGASDDLARGQSTFMVEMAETASILHQVTARSLVILDEIGRGTSTYDGISIAWAVAEYLLKIPEKRAKTLFATHYYELTELERVHTYVQNCTVAVAEKNDDIVFLHKIIPGKTDRSYGIHVAKIAGLPREVIDTAIRKLQTLEDTVKEPLVKAPQKGLEPDLLSQLVLKQIKDFDLTTSSPLQLFQKFADWQRLLN